MEPTSVDSIAQTNMNTEPSASSSPLSISSLEITQSTDSAQSSNSNPSSPAEAAIETEPLQATAPKETEDTDSVEPNGKKRRLDTIPTSAATTLMPYQETKSNPNISDLDELNIDHLLPWLLERKLEQIEKAKKEAQSNISKLPFFDSDLWKYVLADINFSRLAADIVEYGKARDQHPSEDPHIKIMRRIVAAADGGPTETRARLRTRYRSLAQRERAQMKLVIAEFCKLPSTRLFLLS